MIMSGINTVIFKPNSTCSVSSSHAKLFGLSLSDILKSDLWCNKTTWRGFTTSFSWLWKKKIRKMLWIIKALKRGRWGVWDPLLYCNDVWRIQHLIKTEILWNKIQKLHKAAKRLQWDWDFMNEIEVKIYFCPFTHPSENFGDNWYAALKVILQEVK